MDGIFQVVRAFDDAEVIHVEGDVDPCRDMDIISTELRLKDIEWVEKHLDGLKKTGRALGSNSLADKAKKEEIAIIEKIYNVLTKENKDVRKVDWNNKEVRQHPYSPFEFDSLAAPFITGVLSVLFYDDKEHLSSITQLVDGGSNAPLCQ